MAKRKVRGKTAKPTKLKAKRPAAVSKKTAAKKPKPASAAKSKARVARPGTARKAAPKGAASKRAAPPPAHGRAAGSPQMIAALTVHSVESAVAFYRDAFGFELLFTMPGPEGAAVYAQMTFHDGRIMFSPEGAQGSKARTPASSGETGPMQQYVYCPDIDALTERARRAGATVLSEPAIMFWGDRMASFQDPDGYLWAFATNVAEFDPTRMPDQGYAAQT